jgi:hypothetical protein
MVLKEADSQEKIKNLPISLLVTSYNDPLRKKGTPTDTVRLRGV